MGRAAMMDDIAALIADQSEIIRKQADIIDRLFLLLAEYVQVEEIEEEYQMIRDVTEIKNRWEPK